MHDIDRTSYEVSDEAELGEFGSDGELPGGTFDRPFSEAELDELATGLLQVRDEAELDQFIPAILGAATKVLPFLAKSPVGKALTGILKDAVISGVPALSGLFASRSRAPQVGSQVGTAIRSELDWEGVPADSHDIEAAKKIIAIGGSAARELAQQPPNAPPQAVVDAVQNAAQQQGVPANPPPQDAPAPPEPSTSGTWVRRGRTIVLEGL
jgi:hypothetical protein